MRFVSILLIAAGVAAAAQTYTAVLIPGASVQSIRTASPIGFNSLFGLNNKGQVIGDGCNIPCAGVNRFPAMWSNGVVTPLPIPSGYAYIAQSAYYSINDSGTVVGTLQVAGTSTSHVVVWTNGIPTVLPDASIPGACVGPGCTCSPNPSSTLYSVGSSSFGINAAGHIVGSTTYPPYQGGGQPCSGYWVYNGATFRLLPVPVPSMCTSPPLPPGYAPGVGLGFGAAMNDADQVVQTLNNFFCGPPYITPGFPGSDPVLEQANGTYSFLALGSLAAATGGPINDIGDVLGSYSNGGGRTDVLVWDKNGIHDLGPSGYASLNNVGQVIYLTTPGVCTGGQLAMWQNGVSTPIQLPQGLFPSGCYAASRLNDAGQFTAGDGVNFYLLSPSGACAQDVTSQVQITRTGFRYNHSTGLFALIGSITNTSGSPIPGPISLVVDNLPASATLYGISGATLCAAPQGSPYIDIGNIGAGQVLAPGASISGSIDFIDTAQTGITYNLRVLAGPGGR